MDSAAPPQPRQPPDKPLPVIGEGGRAGLIKGGVVGQHHHVGMGRQGGFQLEEAGAVLGVQHVVGVHPQAVLLGGLGKGKIPGLGEIPHPGEVVHLGPGLLGQLHGAVRAAGVHHNDLLHQALDGFQAPGQQGLLVFHNHAQADSDQWAPPCSVGNDVEGGCIKMQPPRGFGCGMDGIPLLAEGRCQNCQTPARR